jgi:predicted homoserine dehydrogenase-like protein
MIIVDNALKKRDKENNPIKVGLVGAGSIGRGIVLTIERSIPGMKVAVLYNRTLSKAKRAFEQVEIENVKHVHGSEEADQVIEKEGYAVTDDISTLTKSKNIDVIIEATGEIEFGAKVALQAIDNKKDIVVMNPELDATVGPILKVRADRQGVIFTDGDGDQPGVVMNLLRFVETIGYRPVLAGNIKGLQDHYRTPETQKEFAEKNKQSPKMVTSFADGTKISMEMAVVANATGFKVGQRGMYGPECDHVSEALELFPKEEMLNGGLVDYILGAEPGPGVFVIGYNDDPIQKEYMSYFKMGDGPFYVFYVPYHLPHLEVPLTAARAVLFDDATITPLGGPVCDVVTLAKKDLKKGEELDGIGGFTCYGAIENTDIARNEELLPMGLSENCVLKKDINKDEVISFEDVEISEQSLAYMLWQEQCREFKQVTNQ